MTTYKNTKPYDIFVPEAVDPNVPSGGIFEIAAGAIFVPGDGIEVVAKSAPSSAQPSVNKKPTRKGGD